VEAEEDGEGKAEKVTARSRGADGRGGEADRERDVEHLGQGRGKESREVRQGGVEEPVRGGERGGEVREKRRGRGGGRQTMGGGHGRC
jgi:hypothetical protein